MKSVQEYYGQTLQSSNDLKTNACCPANAQPVHIHQYLKNIHPDVLNKFYGCGSPLPKNLTGKTVLDLGCGTGRDCYIASQMVGEQGQVIGVDMTKEQLKTATNTLSWHMEKFGYSNNNVQFHLGKIEDLSFIETESVDVVISNCVINLCHNKEAVFKEIHRVLKEDGELYFSDVYSNKPISKELQNDPVLWGECLSGALSHEQFKNIMEKVGFKSIQTISNSEITVNNPQILEKLKGFEFQSITYSIKKNKKGCCA